MKVTVLGTGLMGAGMARSMMRAGLDVTVWNRSIDKARPLEDAGARLAAEAGTAVETADVVVTMLFDTESVRAVMEQAAPAMHRDAIWLQTSTVGLAGVADLAELAARHNVRFLDAPVLGTRQPAENGALIVLAAGPVDLREPVGPVLDAIGSRTVWVGERPGDGHKLKLAANSWVLSLTAATAQAIALTRAQGLDPASFLDVISGGPLDSAYAQMKGKAMIGEDFEAAFGLDGAVKDSALIVEAMQSAGTDATVMSALYERFRAAAEQGYGSADMAAVIHGFDGAQR